MGHQVVAVCDEVTGTSLAGVEEILRACGGKRRLCERERERTDTISQRIKRSQYANSPAMKTRLGRIRR